MRIGSSRSPVAWYLAEVKADAQPVVRSLGSAGAVFVHDRVGVPGTNVAVPHEFKLRLAVVGILHFVTALLGPLFVILSTQSFSWFSGYCCNVWALDSWRGP
jgi:hypothetical protein